MPLAPARNCPASFDTARTFTTINGVQGHGGAIDNATVVAGNGMVFVQSGYGLMGVPGNLLLAFKRSMH